jgi:glutaryl-CoA dehydrogenase
MRVDAVERVLGIDAQFKHDEREWRDKARRFANERIVPTIEEDFENRHFRSELVGELGELGILGMHITGYGCAGAGAVSYGLVCLELEAADSGWRTFVSVQGSLAMSAIHAFGTEDQKQRWLPPMARGEAIGSFALTEPTGGSDPAGMLTTAKRDGSSWVINGRKRWIGLASVADVIVVWAATDDGIRGFLVPAGTEGCLAVPIDNKLSMRASIQCDVFFEDCRIPASAMLPGAHGLSGPFSCLNEARYGIIWGVMGAARSCLSIAIDRSKQRQVFGKPIGAMQLTQLKLADMFVEYEKGVLLALHIGRMKEAGALSHAQISVGKLNNVREAIRIAGSARSILGGDGVTSEYPVMRHMANLESVRTYEGTDEVHSLILGRELTEFSAFS